MKNLASAAAALMMLAGPALADGHAVGDAAKGKKGFNKCKACHAIVADDGDVILKGGKTGPNLFGVIGRQAGAVEGYRYGDDLVKAGAEGVIWDADSFLAYVQDPRGFLREALDDKKARSKMSFKLRKGGEDVYAYLVSVAPAITE